MKLVGERRALAAAVLAFYFIMYLMAALSGDPATQPPLLALAGVYGLAFFALVAGYFWARWYAVGVGLFGIIVAAVLTWTLGAIEPVVVFIGGTHLLATLALWGTRMSEAFDGQLGWRERFHMDEGAVQRLGRSVIRAGVSLPFVLLYALTPKPDGMMFVALGLAGFGFAGLVRLRTWGLLALGAGGVVMLASTSAPHWVALGNASFAVSPVLCGVLLLAAAAPFARPMLQHLRTSGAR